MNVKLSSPLVLASHNEGKLREFDLLLKPLGLRIVSAGSLDLPEPEETGETFEANSELKAVAAAQGSRLTALADDSGLCVEGLDGAPGIYSARWAGEKKDFGVAIERIQHELRAKGIEPEGAKAHFVCVLTLADAFGNVDHVRGEVHGHLTFPARGDKGFGYDPIFVPEGHAITFAEMEPTDKHAMSHRARALNALKEILSHEKHR